MTRRTSAVLSGLAAVLAGALLLAWVHASASGYAPADPRYETSDGAVSLTMVVGFVAIAVSGVCLAAVGWWRPFLAGLALAYLTTLVLGDPAPLLATAPDRMAPAAVALLEAGLLAAPTWVVAERARRRPRPLPIPDRLALSRRRQPALPSPKHG